MLTCLTVAGTLLCGMAVTQPPTLSPCQEATLRLNLANNVVAAWNSAAPSAFAGDTPVARELRRMLSNDTNELVLAIGRYRTACKID